MGAELFHADGRTERNTTKLIVALCNFANTPKKHKNISPAILHRPTILEPQNNTEDERTGTVLLDLRFSQLCRLRFKPRGTRCHLYWQVVRGVSTDHTVFIFRTKNILLGLLDPKDVSITIRKRRREIPEEMNLQRFTQRVIQEKRPIYWEVRVSVIMRKKGHMNMCLVLHGYREKSV